MKLQAPNAEWAEERKKMFLVYLEQYPDGLAGDCTSTFKVTVKNYSVFKILFVYTYGYNT